MDLVHVDQNLLARVNQLIDAVKAKGGKPVITSGYRTPEEQAAIKTPYPKAAPGKSKHNPLPAEALDVAGDANTMKLLHTLAPAYGLTFPVANDPVHVEFAGPSAPSTGATTATAVAQPVGLSVGGATDFLKSLVSLSTWIRVFEVIAGVVLIGIGITLTARDGVG